MTQVQNVTDFKKLMWEFTVDLTQMKRRLRTNFLSLKKIVNGKIQRDLHFYGKKINKQAHTFAKCDFDILILAVYFKLLTLKMAIRLGS